MTISMYQASAPVFLNMLKGLSHVLSKAEAHAAEKGMDPQALIDARLAPDMFPLAKQVQIATDHAKGACSRLAGREVPKFEDTEKTFAELQERIAKTVNHLNTFSAKDIDGSEERTIVLPMRSGEMTFTGLTYLLNFAMPNFYFHVTTAYDILRHEGVPLGKTDFFGVRRQGQRCRHAAGATCLCDVRRICKDAIWGSNGQTKEEEMSHQSTANVTTEMASRYLQQLCKHFSHKLAVEFTPEAGMITFPFGQCTLAAQGGLLTMTLTAEAETDLERLKEVIASHLERFAFRDKPEIAWS